MKGTMIAIVACICFYAWHVTCKAADYVTGAVITSVVDRASTGLQTASERTVHDLGNVAVDAAKKSFK
jgi:hypothetical protein